MTADAVRAELDVDAASAAALARVVIRFGQSVGDELAEIVASVPHVVASLDNVAATVHCTAYREHQLEHVPAPVDWLDPFACPSCGRRPDATWIDRSPSSAESYAGRRSTGA